MTDKTKNTELDDNFKKMIERSKEIKKNNSGARDQLNQAKALSESGYKAAKRLAETEQQLLDLYIKNKRVVDLAQVKQKAKKISKTSVKKEKLGLTQGDKLWGKEGLKARASKGLQYGLHAAGAVTENPLFNLAGNAWGKRSNRISETRQNVYEEDKNKKEQNRKQNDDQENLETDTGSSKGNGQTDEDGNFVELVAEARTTNKLLGLLVSGEKEEIELERAQGEQLELFNEMQEEALEDEELSQKKTDIEGKAPEKVEEKREKKKELKEKNLNGKNSITDLIYGMGALSTLFTTLIPLLTVGAPILLALGGVTAVGSVLKDAYDAHERENKEERAEVDKTLDDVKTETKNIEDTTEAGSEERTTALEGQREKLKLQSKKVSDGQKSFVDNYQEDFDPETADPNFNDKPKGDPEHPGQHEEPLVQWIDSHITTPDEQKKQDDIAEAKRVVSNKITKNKAIANKQEKQFMGEDHTDQEKQDFYAPKIEKLEEEIKRTETLISNLQRKDGTVSTDNKEEYAVLSSKLSRNKEKVDSYKQLTSQNNTVETKKKTEEVKTTATIEAKVKKQEAAKDEAELKAKAKKEAKVKKEAEEIATAQAEKKKLKVAKSQPTQKNNGVMFSAMNSNVEVAIRKKEDAIFEAKKKENKELMSKRTTARNKFGKDSEEYKTAKSEFSVHNKATNKYRRETIDKRIERESYRRTDIMNYGHDEATKREAEREHMKMNKDNQPIIVQQGSGGGQVAQPESKQPVVISTKDDFGFGGRLNDQH